MAIGPIPPHQGFERSLVALCLWREARGESTEAKRGVYWVINNRTLDKRWPNTFWRVILQVGQFSSFSKSDPNSTLMPLPDDPAFADCQEIVDDPGQDPTNGANAYHSIAPGGIPGGYPPWPHPGGNLPKWADPLKLTVRIGAFSFYRL